MVYPPFGQCVLCAGAVRYLCLRRDMSILEALKSVCINRGDKMFFQYKNTLNVLVSYF